MVRASDQGLSTPPRTPYEAAIHAIWSDVLGFSAFGVHDDFFELGGHSLLAPKIVARIRRTLGVQIPVQDFFGCRTVAALASVVAAASSTPPRVIHRRPPEAASVLSFDQQRLWLENQLLPSVAYNVHGRRRLRGKLDVEAFETSVRVILTRHESLRTRFPLVDGRPVQVVDDLPDDWRLDFHDLSTFDGDREAAANRLADEQSSTPFTLATGPLLRCMVIRLSEDEHVLSITAHHIVCDDWSVGLFVRELSALYATGGDAARAGLTELPIQYRDYAAWQREQLVGDRLEQAVSYWRTHLAAAPAALTMPVARRRADARRSGDQVRTGLSDTETTALRTLCRTHGVSTFMVLLAALSTVLGRWSGQRDLVVGVPIAGRTDAGTDTLIGFLVNTLPIRVDLTGEPTFAELLTRVRQVSLDGYAHSDAPLDVLVEQLDITRDPRRSPLFEVILNVIGGTDGEQLPGLDVAEMAGPTTLPSKFDLVLSALESGGRLQLQLDFNPERYPLPLMRTLVAHLDALLRAVIADPGRAILAYPLDPAPAAPLAAADGSPGDDWAVGRFGLTRDDRFAALSRRPGLVAAATATASAAGGTLIACPDGLDPGRWLRDNAVTVAYLSPPQVRALTGPLPALRYAFVDNDGQLLSHDVEVLRRLAPGARFVALYRAGQHGRPLATHTVPDDWSLAAAPLRVPLGEELPGAPATLAHPGGQSAATGEVAQLCFGADRTGALARRWPDGTLELVGTVGADLTADPVETVAELRDLPDVTDAIVTTTVDAAGDRVLIGYLTGPDPDGNAAALRQRLLVRLPEHLIPRHLFILGALPRTTDGEYDLAMLPLPDWDEDEDNYVAPRTPMEARLVEIFQELLEVPRIGVHDTFFELNGFSLLATQLAARIRETFHVDLPLREVFGSPTVEGLAQLILRMQSEQDDELEALLAEVEAQP